MTYRYLENFFDTRGSKQEIRSKRFQEPLGVIKLETLKSGKKGSTHRKRIRREKT